MLVAVLASGIAAAAVHGSDHASRQSAAVSASTPTTLAAPVPPLAQTAVVSKAATVTARKPAAAMRPARPAPSRKAPAGGPGKLPYTGPSPVGPTVGLAVLLLALGAWSVGAPRPLWMTRMSAIDRLRARGRYRTAR